MKSYKHLRLTVLTIFISTLAFTQSDEDGIKQTINSLFNGMRQADMAMIRASFAPGGILQSIGNNKDGKVVVRSEPLDSFIHFVGLPHTEIYDEQIVFESIKIDGVLASVWTPYKFYVGKKFSHCGVDAYQMVKLNGVWKIQYLIDTRSKQGCDTLPGF